MLSLSDCNEIEFVMHPQINLEPKRPNFVYQQIDFIHPTSVSFLTFRNFYTASILIKYNAVLQAQDEWQHVMERQLMQHPNYEDDAQDEHVIRLNLTTVKSLRFYLFQNSPNWKSFALQNLKCFAIAESRSLVKLVCFLYANYV